MPSRLSHLKIADSGFPPAAAVSDDFIFFLNLSMGKGIRRDNARDSSRSRARRVMVETVRPGQGKIG